MPYQIAFERTAEKELLALPRPRERILRALHKLLPDPFAAGNVKALKGGGGYWLRVGDYRVLFTVETEILLVLVVKVGHCKEVYRD